MSKKPEQRNEKKRARDEARRQIRLNDREKILLERQLVREGKIYPRSHYMPRGTFRSILAVVLAFFLGIFLFIGGIVGGGAYVGTKVKIKDVLGLFLEEAQYSQYIDEEYAELSVLGLVQDFIKSEYNSIGDFVKYSPFLDQEVDKLLGLADAFGATIDKDTLYNTAFSGLADYFQNFVLRSVVIGKAANLKKGDNAVLLALCFGEEGVDYTYNDDDTVNVLNPDATLTVGKIMGQESFQEVLNGIRLGTLLSISKGVSEEDFNKKSVLFALSYGKRGVDYDLDTAGNVVIYHDEKAVTVGQLMNDPDSIINGVELGTLLSIDRNITEEAFNTNSMMYAICYGTQGKDYNIVDGTVVPLEGRDPVYPTTLDALIHSSNSIIENLEVETLMSVKPRSEKALLYLAYGSEMMKGTAPYAEGKDADGRSVDAHGYLLGEDGNFLTEEILGKDGTPTGEYQYAGGGRYVFTYDAAGTVDGVTMLPDPNKTDGSRYEKRKVKDLTGEDADILGNAKIGDFIDIGEDASALMQTLKNWTISDLQSEEKLESLQIGQLIAVDASSSNILRALQDKTLGDLKKQETINSLRLGDVLDIEEGATGILAAMKDWRISDLGNQNRINRLKIGQLFDVGEGSSMLMTAIKDWRIGDLTKQEKIDSLTLGDVIKIDGTSGILASLKDTPIGDMQSRIDTLHLSDILDEEELDGNDFLKHLKSSTLTTLAYDVQHLTVGQVFGDQIYSYMKIETVNKDDHAIRKDYNWYKDNYLGEISEEYRTANKDAHPELEEKVERKGVATDEYVYKYYYQLAEFNNTNAESGTVYRPQALEGANSKTVATTYQNADSVAVTLSYSANPRSYVPVSSAVLYDSEINKANGENKTNITPYYIEEKISLTPVYAYYIYNYETGDATVKYDGEALRDDAGDYYYMDGETRVDLDKVLTGYTYGGDSYSLNGNKITWNDKDYTVVADAITVRTPVYQMYVTDGGVSVDAAEVVEKYSYEGAEVDRYLSGVWYLLLAKTDETGKTTYQTDTAILEVANLIGGVNSGMQDSTFAELWFHEILEDNPYASLVVTVEVKSPIPKTVTILNGITFKHKDASENEPAHTVRNLIEVRLSEVVALIDALLVDLEDIPNRLGLGVGG